MTERPWAKGALPFCVDVIDQFLVAAAAYPDRAAIVTRRNTTSYADLERLVRGYAYEIRRRGAERVLIALPQDEYAYAAILAAGLAGAIYAPLNLGGPAERRQAVAVQFQPDIIFSSGEIASELSGVASNCATIDPLTFQPAGWLEGAGQRHATAYVIFTSGSTGRPKGVVIPRTALNHYGAWVRSTLRMAPQDRVSQHSGLGFDVSVVDIYGALGAGASLHPVTGGDRLFPGRFIARDKITVWTSVPSVISMIAKANEATLARLGSVRCWMLCGEALTKDTLRLLFETCPDTTVYNSYGPTELTVTVTEQLLTRSNYEAVCTSTAPIGEAFGDMQLLLIGGRTEDEGELVVVGPQVASGYWNDPVKTAEVFRDVDLSGGRQRAYFTGDWVERWNGRLYFKERIDFQVKLRGYRIELDEIVAAIATFGWPTACVFKRDDQLIAIIEAVNGQRFDAQILRDQLLTKLEAYAVPDVLLQKPHIELTENGKLDRAAAIRWAEAQFSP